MRGMLLALTLVSCSRGVVRPSAPAPLPPHEDLVLDHGSQNPDRLLGQESYLRAYLTWFGELVPLEVQREGQLKKLLGAWKVQ